MSVTPPPAASDGPENAGTAVRPSQRSRFFPALFLLLAAGAAARVFLVLAGGQFFISDEGRYLHGLHLYYFATHGEWHNAAAVLQHPDNWGFILVAAGTTAVQHAVTFFSANAGWPADLAALHRNLFLGAILLSLAPLATVWIVYHLAQRLGADAREAFCAALVLSFSNTAFYFSRHLFPYDTSIALTAAAVLIAAGPPGKARSFLAGMVGGAAFHVYNGYWFLLPMAVAARFLVGGKTRGRLADTSFAFGGEAVALALPYALGWWLHGAGFLQSTMVYGHSIVQGLYREGWSLPWEYLWHSEGVFGAIALALPVAVWMRLRSTAIPNRVKGFLAAAAGIYLAWVTVSSVAHVFVLNARTVKPLVAPLALFAGWGLAALTRQSLRAGVAAGILLVALGVINLAPQYWLAFPRDFEAVAAHRVGNPKRTASVSGSYFDAKTSPVTASDYVLVNAQYLYPIRSAAERPDGDTVMSAAHPLEYTPYQYDGFTPRQRQILRSTDIRMRLVHLTDPAAVPDLPGAEFQCVNGDWPDGFDSEAALATESQPAASPVPNLPSKN